MGPAVGREGDRAWRGVEIWAVPGGPEIELLGLAALVLKGDMPCETPSGRKNCSRISKLVLPLANGSGYVQNDNNNKIREKNKTKQKQKQ